MLLVHYWFVLFLFCVMMLLFLFLFRQCMTPVDDVASVLHKIGLVVGDVGVIPNTVML